MRMSARRGASLAVIALLAAPLLACTPDSAPPPSPSPSGFASEEEAFAAAEETYRAYIDALNAVDLQDPETFEPLYELTAGAFNADLRESYSERYAAGWTSSGAIKITLTQPMASNSELDSVSLHVCVDVSNFEAHDADGNSVVSPDREDVQALTISLKRNSAGQFLLTDATGRTGEPACDS